MPTLEDFPRDYTEEELEQLFGQHYDYVPVTLYLRVLASHIRLLRGSDE